MAVPYISRRKYLPVGTKGSVCGHRFTVTERGERPVDLCGKVISGGWKARVMLDNGKPDTAWFTDDHVTSIPNMRCP
jgi:hypothetical protein